MQAGLARPRPFAVHPLNIPLYTAVLIHLFSRLSYSPLHPAYRLPEPEPERQRQPHSQGGYPDPRDSRRGYQDANNHRYSSDTHRSQQDSRGGERSRSPTPRRITFIAS